MKSMAVRAVSLALMLATAGWGISCGSAGRDKGLVPATDAGLTDAVTPPALDLGPAALDLLQPDLGVTYSMSLLLQGPVTYGINKAADPLTKISLVLALQGQGEKIQGLAGVVWPSTRNRDGATVKLSGTLKAGTLSLGPADIPASVPYGHCAEWVAITGARISGTISQGKFSGTLTGKAHQNSGDTGSHYPIIAALTGAADKTAPALVPHSSEKVRGVFQRPWISFTEPVKPKGAGATLLNLTAGGKVLASALFKPAADPGGYMVRARLAPAGHLPFGAKVSIATAGALADLAGNALAAGTKVEFSTAPNPGLLSDAGFESGTLKNFSGHGASVVESLGTLKPPQGTKMAQLSTVTDGYLAARIKLPAGAKKIRVALDLVWSYGGNNPGQCGLHVATPAGLSTTLLSKVMPKADKPIPGSGYKHSGFTDVAVDVSALAGQEVVLAIGTLSKLPYHPPYCPGSWTPDMDLLMDNIRVE